MASHHAFLVLALAVAVLARTVAAGPPPCAYSEIGAYANQYNGNCGINPAFVVSQVGISPMAKFTIASTKASIACASHNVKSGKPADIAKCLADKANFCFLDGIPGNWACLSNSNAIIAGVLCAGSVYAQWITCQAKYQSDCTGACQWRPDLQRNYTEFLLYRNLTGGAYDTMGFCQPTQYTAKFKTFADFNTWTQSFGPSDPKKYAAVRGTCQYAKDGFARFQYDSLCYSFNNAKDSSLGLMLGSFKPDGSPNFTGIDATAATKCLTAGCELDYLPAKTAFSYGADFFQCSTSPRRRFSLGYFSPLDKGLNAAVQACTDVSVRYNKVLCEAATI